MDRYYLFKLFGFGVMLHRIHASDPDGIYHNHPWNCLSIIFGKYVEWHADVQWHGGRVVGITHTGHLRRLWNLIAAKQYHRVELVDGKPVWTLVFHLPRSNRWSTINKEGGIAYEPWKGAGKGRSYAAALEAVPLADVNLDASFNIRSDPNTVAAKLLEQKIEESGWTKGTEPYAVDVEIIERLPQGTVVKVDAVVKVHDVDNMIRDYKAGELAIVEEMPDGPKKTRLLEAIEKARGGPPPTQRQGFA